MSELNNPVDPHATRTPQHGIRQEDALVERRRIRAPAIKLRKPAVFRY